MLDRHMARLCMGAAGALAFATAALAQTPVRVGTLGAISDAPIFIADKKGYFKDEG